MPKKLIFTIFLLFSLIGFSYPTKKEKVPPFNYCYSLEKLLFKNSLQIKKNIPNTLKSITSEISKLGLSKTKGALIKKVIDQYKSSKKVFIITIIPNKIYCLVGYWIEDIKPGTFETIIYKKSKSKINEFYDMKDNTNKILNDINSEYKIIKKEFDNFLNKK